jgi:hypothetical protein
MGFVCKKTLMLSGSEYHPGDVIPDGTILDSRVRALKTSGHIVEVSTDPKPEHESNDVTLTVPVITDSGEVINVDLTVGEVQHVFCIMQMNAEDASKEIENIQSNDELVIIHAADSRKSVQKAAKERASYLYTTKE